MTKLLVGTIALVLIVGCSAPAADGSADTTPSSQAAVSLTAEQPDAAESSTEAAPAADSDYALTIDGSRVAKDYKDRPALVVDFTFTNNSDKAQSFMFAIRTKAFQDGIELESATFLGDDIYNAADSMKDIKPGKSLKVQGAYALDSNADVEIEATEVFSFDDALIASATIKVK